MGRTFGMLPVSPTPDDAILLMLERKRTAELLKVIEQKDDHIKQLTKLVEDGHRQFDELYALANKACDLASK